MRDYTCPTCGHGARQHADTPGTECTACRREANPYTSGNPRRPEDVCTLTSGAVRGRVEANSFFADRETTAEERANAINDDLRNDRAQIHHLLDEQLPEPADYEERR